MWRDVQRWRGVVLIGIAVVATIWLSFGNQLVLYIHPRYILFTVIMGVIALVLVAASLIVRTHPEDGDEDVPRRGARALSTLGLVIAGVIAAAMIVVPPATLSSATASQRDINSSTILADTQSVSDASSASNDTFKGFTVVDWASLLRQTSDLQFYAGKPVDVVGFITPDPDDPQNMFYVSRFVVTCCAVDAQPTGIPVFLANWQDTYATDDWVQVTGTFATNPSTASSQSVALKTDSVTKVDQPSEPYLF
ncbi:MAG: TIGR03943 family protein [Micrococcales bacterium 70-64]|nr:TIGR03943 family protein [Leifsonia sp.]ODU64823.1 MAG: TIGR03943 family protein [Leifsonia sp. SCN 70-46]OJX86514.1 MAG: TIGR03943 family protein [Micrococcales bacterium 70-64]